MTKTAPGHDGIERCAWCTATPEYIHYHDHEWGFPVGDDRRLFEKLCLEGFQAGLSWRTILTKRENFRQAFAGFDFNRIAQFTQDDVARLLADVGIVRHRGKIEAVINNARRAQETIADYGSLAAFLWSFAPGSEAQAALLSQSLKKRGWGFVGPTTVYAFMQACGMVNDHAPECASHAAVAEARQRFTAPR